MGMIIHRLWLCEGLHTLKFVDGGHRIGSPSEMVPWELSRYATRALVLSRAWFRSPQLSGQTASSRAGALVLKMVCWRELASKLANMIGRGRERPIVSRCHNAWLLFLTFRIIDVVLVTTCHSFAGTTIVLDRRIMSIFLALIWQQRLRVSILGYCH